MRSRRRSLQSEPNQNSTTFNLEYFVRVPLGMLLTHRVVHSSFVQAINEVIVPALDLQMGSSRVLQGLGASQICLRQRSRDCSNREIVHGSPAILDALSR
jgi:hypothetical protein